MKTINFDKIPNQYAKGKGWMGVPKSNDALYIDKYNKWYFIEFKNGYIKLEDIYRKIYDSLIMLLEWNIIPDFEFCRRNINYILVYNEEVYGKIQPSVSRQKTYEYISKLAKKEVCLFHIDKLKDYLFSETHTYNKEMFNEKFILEKEKEEVGVS